MRHGTTDDAWDRIFCVLQLPRDEKREARWGEKEFLAHDFSHVEIICFLFSTLRSPERIRWIRWGVGVIAFPDVKITSGYKQFSPLEKEFRISDLKQEIDCDAWRRCCKTRKCKLGRHRSYRDAILILKKRYLFCCFLQHIYSVMVRPWPPRYHSSIMKHPRDGVTSDRERKWQETSAELRKAWSTMRGKRITVPRL